MEFTWAGGGEHGQGMAVVASRAIPLHKLLLAF